MSPALTSQTYYALPTRCYPLGGRNYLVHVIPTGAVVVTSETTAGVLQRCRGCRALSEHAAIVSNDLRDVSGVDVQMALGSLVLSGLLVPRRLLGGANVADDSGRIRTLAVVTADRPSSLHRCLAACVQQATTHGWSCRLLVADASQQRVHGDANHAVVRELRPQSPVPIEYVDADEAMRLCPNLPWPGNVTVSRATMRNVVALLTAGERVLTIDDDVNCAGRTNRTGVSLEIGGHQDRQVWRYFERRSEAMAALGSTPVDVVRAHEAVLGLSLASLLAVNQPEVDLARACRHLLATDDRVRCRVRASFSGLAGQSDASCADELLFHSGSTRRALYASASTFEEALRSRNVARLAPRTVITHGVLCSLHCTGLANEAPLPPFAPLDSAEARVFGATIAFIEPASAYAYLPHGVIRDGDDDPDPVWDAVPLGARTGLSDVFLAGIAQCVGSVVSTDPAVRLARLAATLRELAHLETSAFIEWFREAKLGQMVSRLRHLERQCADAPAHWTAAATSYRHRVLESVRQPDFLHPAECGGSLSLAEAFQGMQALVGTYADLLDAWPGLWSAAAAANGTPVPSR